MKAQSRWILTLAWVALSAIPVYGSEPVEYTLANGLRVRLVPSDAEKRVCVILGVRAGFVEEPAGVPHLAHVTEHLTVFDLKGKEEAKAVAGWFPKGQANGETLGDFMYFDLHVSPEELTQALRVQAARLAAVELSKETLAREIPRTLEEIAVQEKRDQGATIKFVLAPFFQAVFHGERNVPIKAKTETITLDQVRAFHAHTFRPDRACLLVVGPFDPDAARKAIETEFNGIARPAKALAPRPRLKPGAQTVSWDVSTRHLLLAWPAPPADQDDHAALTLATISLMQRLALDADTRPAVQHALVLNEIEGVFLVNLQLKPDADAPALQKAVTRLVANLAKEEGFKDSDLALAKLSFAQITGFKGLNAELQRSMRAMIWGDLKAYAKRVDGIKAASVPTAVAKHLDPKNATVVIVEPGKK